MRTDTTCFALLLLVALGATGCSGSREALDLDLAGQRVAVVAAIPPQPLVFTDALPDVHLDPDNPAGSFFRAGTAFAKQTQVHRAQQRLDSALLHIDVSERIARRTLLQSARALHFKPVNQPEAADYLLDLRVADYGLVADSWESAVFFEIDALLMLVDPQTERTIWERRLRETEPVSEVFVDLGPGLGHAVTAVELARLSVDDTVRALERLADHTADRLAEALRHDVRQADRMKAAEKTVERVP